MIVTFERDIKNDLIELEKSITKSLKSDFFNEKVSKNEAFTKVLSYIADILFKTSIKHDEWHHEINKDKQFSFFPGYVDNLGERLFSTCVLSETKSKNSINIKISDEKKGNNNVLEKNQLFLDFWYNRNTCNSKTYTNSLQNSNDISLLSLAYHFLFRDKSEKQLEEEKLLDENSKPAFSFEIGGTHQWASQVADEIAINDALDPLTLLAFYDNKKDSRDNQLKYKSWIIIPFQLNGDESEEVKKISKGDEKIKWIQEEIFGWCESVVNKLNFPSNSKEIENINERWPYNPNCNLDINNDKFILIYRAYIVAFWMQLVLRPDRFFKIIDKKITSFNEGSYEVKAWFDFTNYFIENKINNLANWPIPSKTYLYYLTFRQTKIDSLLSILKEPGNYSLITAHNYKYWYTIPFRHRIDFSNNSLLHNNNKVLEERKETGSAMILSNYLLDGEYFRFIIPWLNQLYNAMREYDTAVVARDLEISSFKVEIDKLRNISSFDLIKNELNKLFQRLQNDSIKVDADKLVR